MAQIRSKIFAVLLTTVFAGNGLMAAASVVSAKPVASCHEHPHSTPTPKTNYQCCVAGHSVALQPDVRDLYVPFIMKVSEKSTTFVEFEAHTFSLHKTNASPPPLIALRI